MNIIEKNVNEIIPYINNPRKNDNAVDKVAASIKEFGFKVPCVISSDNVIVTGHTRIKAAKKLGMETVPCIIADDLTDAQIKAFRLADNKVAEFSEWDFEKLEIELEGLSEFNFEDFGLQVDFDDGSSFFKDRDRNDNSKQKDNEEYNKFLDKFETKKTTDDCYTPDNIYNAVAGWVAEEYGVNKEDFVRPFYPNGDYQKFNYTEGAVVVDNPPFSILAEILKWYTEREIKFFLFAPSLTIITATACDLTYFTVGAQITYENGANVSTGFITNLDGEYRLRTAPDLLARIKEQNDINLKEKSKDLPNYVYPDYVICPAQIMKIAHYEQDLRIKKSDCIIISELDEQKKEGKTLFGKGLLLSEKAAAEKAAAEKAAAEKAAAKVWQLSERELEIVKGLGTGLEMIE